MPDVTVPTAAPLAARRGVELIRTGTWHISTGVWTATPSDLAACIAALDCPAVRRPVLKLGHTDPRFDGEPAVGWVDNLDLADGGATLVGDYVGMPGWLGDVIASAYPDRSIEGVYDFACQVGHLHPFVLTGVALLGVTPPGVGNLASLQDVATLYGVAASSPPSGTHVAATVDNTGRVRAAAVEHTGAMVALIPTPDDATRLAVDDGEPAAELHVTLAYLGAAADWTTDTRAEVVGLVQAASADLPAVAADGFALSLFNPGDATDREPCVVLGLSGADITTVHDAVTTALASVAGIPEQHQPWHPHITLAYTADPAGLAALTDRVGPVSFDRIRVAFGGDHTDIPLTGAQIAASTEGTTMPNPNPALVAAGVSTEDVRRAYYDDAGWDYWITEFQLDPLQLIICDDRTGKHFRVGVNVDGDSFTFAAPVEVTVEYVDKPAGDTVAAARLVYASRAESRPGPAPAATQPTPAVDADPAPHEEPTDPPAAEPDTTTEPIEEDPVSTHLGAVRSRLGLPDDADEAAVSAAVIAALDGQPDAPDPNPDPPKDPATDAGETPAAQAVAASGPALPEGVVTIDRDTLASLRRDAELGAAAHERQRLADRDSEIQAAMDAGKFAPARRAHWVKAWEADPEGTKATLASLERGLVVPTVAAGVTGTAESDAEQLDTDLASGWAAELGISVEEMSRG